MEIWKPIEGHDGYEVSSLGRVRSYKRGRERLLKPHFFIRSPYYCVYLYIGGKSKPFTIHKLVAQTFIPNPENKPQVNHINGVKTDNRVENLEWVTASENTRHAIDTGLMKSGEEHSRAKLTIDAVLYIRENPNHLTLKQLGEKFGVDQSAISMVQLGKNWQNAGGSIRKPNRSCMKISIEQRNEIRRLYVKGSAEFGSYGLAKKYGVHQTTILNIVHED